MEIFGDDFAEKQSVKTADFVETFWANFVTNQSILC